MNVGCPTKIWKYGRRAYQAEYFKFLTYAIASNDDLIKIFIVSAFIWLPAASHQLPGTSCNPPSAQLSSNNLCVL